MITPALSECRPDSLYQLLTNRVSVKDESQLIMHVEQCERCRLSLENMAAVPRDWETARASLSDCLIPGEKSDSFKEEQTSVEKWGLSKASDDSFWFMEPVTDEGQLGALGTIRITSVIGRGGMGIVFKGYDTELKRDVVVKVLAPELSVSATARARFQREAESVAAVVHEHVVPIHAIVADYNPPYLVMAFVPGCSLQDRITRCGPMSPAEVLRVGVQIAKGLDAAHTQGIVHRDIKPANVLLEHGVERVKLTDFGLARAVDDTMLTRCGAIAGTPLFMSPEQARGERVDFRSDLFSLGSTLYVMGTGVLPFRSDTSMSVMHKICEKDPVSMLEHNPNIPLWLNAVIMRLLAKNPDDRFQSAEEVAGLLEKSLAHVQQPGLIPLPSELMRYQSETGSQFRNILAVAAVAVTLIFVVSFFPGRQGSSADETETAVADEQGQPQAAENPVSDQPENKWAEAVLRVLPAQAGWKVAGKYVALDRLGRRYVEPAQIWDSDTSGWFYYTVTGDPLTKSDSERYQLAVYGIVGDNVECVGRIKPARWAGCSKKTRTLTVLEFNVNISKWKEVSDGPFWIPEKGEQPARAWAVLEHKISTPGKQKDTAPNSQKEDRKVNPDTGGVVAAHVTEEQALTAEINVLEKNADRLWIVPPRMVGAFKHEIITVDDEKNAGVFMFQPAGCVVHVFSERSLEEVSPKAIVGDLNGDPVPTSFWMRGGQDMHGGGSLTITTFEWKNLKAVPEYGAIGIAEGIDE